MSNNDKLNDSLIIEMVKRQLNDVVSESKFSYNDIQKVSKNLDISIFNEQDCSVWNGYITNANKKNKGTYVNFYFNKKKTALHRLLYLNFNGSIDGTEYIKYTCKNKGKCCNINHMKKYKKNIKKTIENETINDLNISKNIYCNNCNEKINNDINDINTFNSDEDRTTSAPRRKMSMVI
jgi:hypothetical protein